MRWTLVHLRRVVTKRDVDPGDSGLAGRADGSAGVGRRLLERAVGRAVEAGSGGGQHEASSSPLLGCTLGRGLARRLGGLLALVLLRQGRVGGRRSVGELLRSRRWLEVAVVLRDGREVNMAAVLG